MSNLTVNNLVAERAAGGAISVFLLNLTDSIISDSVFRNLTGVSDLIAISGERVKFMHNEVIRRVSGGGGLTSGRLIDSEIGYNYFMIQTITRQLRLRTITVSKMYRYTTIDMKG
jgi:hypothetical protein